MKNEKHQGDALLQKTYTVDFLTKKRSIYHHMGGDCDMKGVKEKALEQAFVRVMNRFIGGKESFVIKDTGRGMCEGAIEDIDDRLAELQQKLMEIVRRAGVDDKDYLTLAAEIELLRECRRKMKDTETERLWRDGQMEELKGYLAVRDGKLLDRFDGDLFREVVEKIRFESIVEVEFVFKAGVEVREVL